MKIEEIDKILVERLAKGSTIEPEANDFREEWKKFKLIYDFM
jgi:hypothetical protein